MRSASMLEEHSRMVGGHVEQNYLPIGCAAYYLRAASAWEILCEEYIIRMNSVNFLIQLPTFYVIQMNLLVIGPGYNEVPLIRKEDAIYTPVMS